MRDINESRKQCVRDTWRVCGFCCLSCLYVAGFLPVCMILVDIHLNFFHHLSFELYSLLSSSGQKLTQKKIIFYEKRHDLPLSFSTNSSLSGNCYN